MANDGRQAHCKRVFKLNDDDTIDPDVWVDVLRIDKLPANFQSTDTEIKGQIINLFFYWNDDPNNPTAGVDGSTADAQSENANASRRTEKLEIRNPDGPDDKSDKSESNFLWIVDGIPLEFSGDDSGKAGQIRLLEFKNDPDNAGDEYKREFTVVKIVNNDLGGMKMADDDGSNPVLVDGETYRRALKAGTTDDSQFLNVEIVDRSDFNFQTSDEGPAGEGPAGQIITFILGNDEVENQFDHGDPQSVPPALRTDPLQSIVNVGFGGLAVEFFDGAD